jgi:hypothetical protein
MVVFQLFLIDQRIDPMSVGYNHETCLHKSAEIGGF